MVLESDKKEFYTIVRVNLSKLYYENANIFSKEAVSIIETQKPHNLAFDFGEVNYLSSIGISALSIIKGISNIHNTNVVLYNITPDVLDVLERTGINTMFKLLNNESDVINYFKNIKVI